MRLGRLLLAAALLGGSSPALAAKPVEVTRFHTPETVARLGPGWIAVEPAPGIDRDSLENRVWLEAVARALARHGFGRSSSGGEVARIAEVRLTSDVVERGIGRGSGSSLGVSLGAGSGGWRGGGVGLGIGFGGGSARRGQVESRLSVVIRDAATRAPLWEGRAVARTRRDSRSADPGPVAERLATALFAGFPGRSGETIEVR